MTNKEYYGVTEFFKELLELQETKQVGDWIYNELLSGFEPNRSFTLADTTEKYETGTQLLRGVLKAAKTGKLKEDELEHLKEWLLAISWKFERVWFYLEVVDRVPMKVYSEDELKELSLEQLRELCVERSIKFAPANKESSLIPKILAWKESV
jgi:hypothetical protein